MSGAQQAYFYIISFISISAGPVYCNSGLCLNLFSSLVGDVEVSYGSVEESGRIQTWSPFKRILSSMDSSSLLPHMCQAILGGLLQPVRPSIEA